MESNWLLRRITHMSNWCRLESCENLIEFTITTTTLWNRRIVTLGWFFKECILIYYKISYKHDLGLMLWKMKMEFGGNFQLEIQWIFIIFQISIHPLENQEIHLLGLHQIIWEFRIQTNIILHYTTTRRIMCVNAVQILTSLIMSVTMLEIAGEVFVHVITDSADSNARMDVRPFFDCK